MRTNIVILIVLVAIMLGSVTWFWVYYNNKIETRIAENERKYGLQSQFKKVDVKNINDALANFVYIKMQRALENPTLLAELAAKNDYGQAFSNDAIYDNLKFYGRSNPISIKLVISNMTSRDAVVMLYGQSYSVKGLWAAYVSTGETIEINVPGETCIASFLLGRRWSDDFELASSVPDVSGGEQGLHGFFLSPAPGAAELLSEGIVMKENYKYKLETKRFLLGNKNGFPGYSCIVVNQDSRFLIKIEEPAFEPDSDSLNADSF